MLAAQRKDEGGRVSQSILKTVDSFVGVSQVKKPTDKFLGCLFWADILFALSCLSELLGIALEVETIDGSCFALLKEIPIRWRRQ